MLKKLMKPREKLIKALCMNKFGHRNYSAREMLDVMAENDLQLHTPMGRDKTEKQMQDAMTEAYNKLN
jgi:hypothetical protein